MTLVRSPSQPASTAVVTAPTGGGDAPAPVASWQEQKNGKWVLNFSQPIKYSDKVHAA